MTNRDIQHFVEENDIKFIKLSFTDIVGRHKNLSILSNELPRAFSSGIAFDASAVRGFGSTEHSDLLLIPDPDTISILPWRPQQGRVARMFCTVVTPEGKCAENDSRNVLKRVLGRASDMGYTINVGTQCEFYLFELDERSHPTLIPHDDAGYCDAAPADKAENVRREICLTLEEMGISPESSHHEQGPGQNEVDFKCADALTAADRLVEFKSVVRMIASRNGLYASFMPKPLSDKSGSGLHVNLSLTRGGYNLASDIKEGGSDPASSFLAGLLQCAPDITAFLNPIVNSYKRLGKMEAPDRVAWGFCNRSALVRILGTNGEYSRMEVRSPDPAINPYTAFALMINSGLCGIEQGLTLCDCVKSDRKNRTEDCCPLLPQTLKQALDAAGDSEFVKKTLGDNYLETYLALKYEEWAQYTEAEDKQAWETQKYFHRI